MANLKVVQTSATVTGDAANSSVQVGIVTNQLCTASIEGITPTSFAWVLSVPSNSDDELSSATAATPTFTLTKSGVYLLSLNGLYTLPLVVSTSEANVYVGPIVPAALLAVQAPVPAIGVSIISQSDKVGSLLTTDLNGLQAPIAMARSGTTLARPAEPAVGLYVGFTYFDTTLGKPLWWNGSVWKDATGATV